VTTFQTCYVAADGSLQQDAHHETDTITFRASPLADLRIDQNGLAWVNGYPSVQTTGAFCAALHPTDPELYVQRGNSGFVDVYNFADFTTPTRSYAEPYVAQAAILRVNPDGTPLMNTSERNGRVVLVLADGREVKLSGWLEDRGWLCGLSDNGLVGGCVFLQKPDGSAWMWSPGHDIQRPIELAVSADGTVCWIAVSDVNPPKPSEIVRLMVPYAAYVAPAPTLPAITIGPQRPIWRGSLNGIVRGNCGNEPDAVNLIEDVRWVMPEQEPRLLALFLDTKAPDAAVGQTAEMAVRNRVPVILDPDGDGDKAWRITDRLHFSEVRVLHALQHYPNKGESMADYEFRVRSSVGDVVIRPLYTFGDASREAEVAACNLVLDRVIADNPKVVMDLGFGLDRPPRSAWCAAYFQQLVNATPTPSVSLRQPPPVITPPVIPTKPPIVLVPKRDKDKAQILGASAGIAGAVIALWQWIKRKRKKKQEAA